MTGLSYDFDEENDVPRTPPKAKARQPPTEAELLDMDPAERADWQERMQDTPCLAAPWWETER